MSQAHEMEQWFEDNGMDSIEVMASFIKVQQQMALELTKLVLEHCKDEKRNKDQVFEIFKDATKIVQSQMGKEF